MAVNGDEYAFEDIQVTINGQLVEASAVEYTTKRDFNDVRGRGKDPVTLGRGNKSYEAQVTVLQSVVEGIQRSLPRGKDLTDVPVEITVSYAPEGGVVTTDQITRGRIKEVKKGGKNGDGNMTVDLPIATPKIIYNV